MKPPQKNPKKPVVLCILDGWGLRSERADNAPALANTPHFDALMAGCPNATLTTHGPAVGLPQGQIGNSEVGHTTIGAGRVIEMDLVRIERVIAEDKFAELAGYRRFCEKLTAGNGRAHLLGLLSDGGVHSHVDHMIHVANCLAAEGIKVFLHLITDGRDVPPRSAGEFLQHLRQNLKPKVQLATICGRYYAFDRDNRWERVKPAYQAIAQGKGDTADTPEAVIKTAHDSDITDEFIPPHVLKDYTGFQPTDGLLCLNFRADRARQILAAFGDKDFTAFQTANPLKTISGFTSYSDAHDKYIDCLFPKDAVKNTLGEWVASRNLKQFRLAETEKYPHVTFFLNGGREQPFAGEDRHLAPSPKVATYDLQPEMACPEVSARLCDAIKNGDYDLIVVNYANPDMVGHSGILTAAIKACEAVDSALGDMINALKAHGGAALICADHGNCETMKDANGKPHTAHTTNLVPLILFDAASNTPAPTLKNNGTLADIAPTLLDLMHITPPPEMTGKSLIQTE